ncbi:MAG: site-specific DNA-methyltransferase [Rhabdochlamydiaceae bacterium]|nr:site-specific DNA-methyltransferase [Rhabdochlamydiaceae bacterium]
MNTDTVLDNTKDLKSMDINSEKKEKLKAIFPSVFIESINEKGDLVESIDYEKLKAELGTFSDLFESRKERYGMDWPGKKECLKVIQNPSLATLKPSREESINFDITENLFIEGDNLEVLKLLQRSYYNKIKMIYIDPPYNTGKEFIYPDHYAESLETYLAYAGLIDDKGKKFSSNTSVEGRFHTKWLNMMYPRLHLAGNLLREDGVIFISIDNHELINLRKLCDEIFGEENHLGTIIWKNSTDNNPTNIATEHEYICVYCKNKDNIDAVWQSHISDVKEKLLMVSSELISKYSNPEELKYHYSNWFKQNKDQLWPLDRYKYIDENGVYTGSQSVHNPGKEGYRYDVIHPITHKPCKEPLMGYRFPFGTMQQLLEEGRILFGEDETKIIELKVYASEYQEKLSSIIELDGRIGAYDLKQLFPEIKRVFTNPKPTRLFEYFISFILKNDEDIILDFFSGSGTTAHALLDFNKTNSKNCKFILIQLPEPCDQNSEVFNLGYKTIADIGKARIERAINKIKHEVGTKADFDLGFKVLKLDKSNFNVWEPTQQITVDELVLKLEGHIPHIDPKASQEDILYELLLKSGYLPTEKVEKQEFAGKTVYSIGDGVLMICLESEITRELIEAVAATDPERFICLDHAFKGNDQLKANAMHAFSSRGSGGNQDVFRTV